MAKNSCQKKPKFSEILGTKVVQFWCYTKSIKNKKCAPKLIFFNKNFFRKMQMIFDIENWLWISDFGTFWQLFSAVALQSHGFWSTCHRIGPLTPTTFLLNFLILLVFIFSDFDALFSQEFHGPMVKAGLNDHSLAIFIFIFYHNDNKIE